MQSAKIIDYRSATDSACDALAALIREANPHDTAVQAMVDSRATCELCDHNLTPHHYDLAERLAELRTMMGL